MWFLATPRFRIAVAVLGVLAAMGVSLPIHLFRVCHKRDQLFTGSHLIGIYPHSTGPSHNQLRTPKQRKQVLPLGLASWALSIISL